MGRRKSKQEIAFKRKYYTSNNSNKLAYTGDANKFAKQFPSKKAKAWLESQEAYSLHRPARKNGIEGNKTIASGVDTQWQADLCDVSNIAKHNDENRFLLTVIDVLSRFAWAVPIPNKTGKVVIAALEDIFQSSQRKPKIYLQTDQGVEFFNPHMKELSKKYNFKHFASYSDHKSALVERFNRTLKTYMYRYFTYKQTYRYMEVLPSLVDGYNRRIHSAHGLAPISVTQKNEHEVFQILYPQLSSKQHKKAKNDERKGLNVGDYVRINKYKNIFEKGYLPNWTSEIFIIASKEYKYPRISYKLKDQLGDDIEGTFFTEHLQQVDKLPEVYHVDSIIRSKKSAEGGKEYLVKWKGYPDKFNSWIHERDMKNIK